MGWLRFLNGLELDQDETIPSEICLKAMIDDMAIPLDLNGNMGFYPQLSLSELVGKDPLVDRLR
jgi:hypothetical protein